ncbi:hypothetical protein CYMTET_23861 [Cymbomonas tetramitiformis]|uniref:Uncharacterized protein n=1 Tax=Cymbomonas tetramitiformis TaxID=36881 RepID=A0AAE0FX27_9CHLO|nr:hypothetical protein CYMTET_23861 [Cymbomonas tetramitiformis]
MTDAAARADHLQDFSRHISSTDRARTLLRGVTFHFHPCLRGIEAVRCYLRTQQPGTAHRASAELILKWDGSEVIEVDVSGLDPADFLSSVDLDSAQEALAERLDHFQDVLGEIAEYEVEVLCPGQVVRLPYEDGRISCFATTNMQGGSYFDLVVYPVHGGRAKAEGGQYLTVEDPATYRNQEIFPQGALVKHSGDVRSLLHHVKCSKPIRALSCESSVYVLAVTGYERKPLHSFEMQLPSVLLVNHKARTIYLVPCPLAKLDVGEATLGALVTLHLQGDGTLLAYPLARPSNVENVDTGDLSDGTQAAMRAAATEFFECLAHRQAALVLAPPILGDASSEPLEERGDSATRSEECIHSGCPLMCADKHPVMVATEVGLRVDSWAIKLNMTTAVSAFLHVRFGQGLAFGKLEEEDAEPSDFARLPVLFGPCTGDVSLACGEASNVNFTLPEYHAYLELAALLWVKLSSTWKQLVARTCTVAANGVFVLVGPPAAWDEGSQSAVEAYVSTANRAGTVLAGPNAIVLVQLPSGRLVFYRGVRWPGFLEEVPKFCTDVTELFSPQRLMAFIASGGMRGLPWPTVVPLANRQVCFCGSMLPLEEFLERLQGMELEALSSAKEDIVDVLTQISVALPPGELQELVGRLQRGLAEKIEARKGEMRKQMRETAELKYRGEAPAAHSEMQRRGMAALTGELRAVQRKVKEIIAALAGMVSQRGSSSKDTDLKRLIRKQNISGRTAAVQQMSLSEKLSFFEEVEEWLMVEVSSAQLHLNLELVATSRFKEQARVAATGHPRLAQLHTSCPQLDECTLSLLYEQTRSATGHPLSSQSHQGLAIPQSLAAPHSSALPLPMLAKFVDLKNPSALLWPDEANEKWVQMYRIQLRATFVDAVASRTLNIASSSTDLTFFLVHTILEIMEGVASGMAGVPGKDAYDNTTCRMQRGLWGLLLTTMASGSLPATTLWQLVMHKTKLEVPPLEELWIAIRMAQVFPYSGWDSRWVVQNTQRLVVRLLRKYLADPLTKPLRDNSKVMRRDAGLASARLRNRELHWVRAACHHLLEVEAQGDLAWNTPATAHLADQLISHFPKSVNLQKKRCSGTKKIFTLLLRLKSMDATLGMVSNTLEAVRNIMAKRGGMFKLGKRSLLELLRSSEAPSEKEVAEMKGDLMNGRILVQERRTDECTAEVMAARMQNRAAVAACNLKQLKGDAELERGAWRVDALMGETQEEFEKRLKDFRGIEGSEEDALCRHEQLCGESEAESEAVVALRPYGGAGLKFARKLHEMSCHQLCERGKIPAVQFEALMRVAGAGDGPWDFAVHKVVEKLLAGFQDTVKAEDAAVTVLQSLIAPSNDSP